MGYRLYLGNQAYSSWSLRGWLLFRAFGIDCEVEVVPLRSAEFERFARDCAPARTVPAVRLDDGFVLWDSLAIAETLHERHPEAGIWPREASGRAAARSLAAEMHSSFFALRSGMPMNVRREYRSFEPDAAARDDIARITELWAWARTRRTGAGPWLFGDSFCAADAFFAPVASRFRTYGIALAGESAAYVDALLAHPATVEFYAAGQRESWVLDDIELDID